MLQARLYALYQGSRSVLCFMIVGYTCEIVAMSTIMGFADAEARSTKYVYVNLLLSIHAHESCYLFGNIVTNEILEGLYICNVQGPYFYELYIFWLPLLVWDSMLCLLALWHGIRNCISGYRARRMDGVHIADVVVKGNAGYFFWYAPSASPLFCFCSPFAR